jgi:hypothetical protein
LWPEIERINFIVVIGETSDWNPTTQGNGRYYAMLLDINPSSRATNSTLVSTRDRLVDDPEVALIALLMRTAQAVERRRSAPSKND